MRPVAAYNLLFALDLFAAGMTAFAERCVRGVEADREVCRRYAEGSPALATALSPFVGYERAAELVRRALREGRSVRELAAEEGIVAKDVLERALDVRQMTLSPEEREEG
jgi:fumarate hydratase class II